ncbi:MAG: 30S ribosomal protein S27e [Candidatus Nanohaloarchaea archaeon]|nr:30S ribosomal protein S27e [Candidatus Nanohaloarchaea archaeon]
MDDAKPRSKFLKVKCGECGNEQDIFDRPSREVKCTVCDETLASNTGGKAEIRAKVLKEH